MRFILITFSLVTLVGLFMYRSARDSFVLVPIATQGELFPIVRTQTNERMEREIPLPQATPITTSTFTPPPGSFHGPVGEPKIIGPTSGPPNY